MSHTSFCCPAATSGATALFVHGGLLMAPGGFEQDGVLLKVLLSGGLYRYNPASLGGQQVIGAETTVQVMPGFRIKRGDPEAKFFFGMDFEPHRLWPDDRANSLRGHMNGLKTDNSQWSAAGGWARDSDSNCSAYVRFGLMQKL